MQELLLNTSSKSRPAINIDAKKKTKRVRDADLSIGTRTLLKDMMRQSKLSFTQQVRNCSFSECWMIWLPKMVIYRHL
jgi:hypothetical protein